MIEVEAQRDSRLKKELVHLANSWLMIDRLGLMPLISPAKVCQLELQTSLLPLETPTTPLIHRSFIESKCNSSME